MELFQNYLFNLLFFLASTVTFFRRFNIKAFKIEDLNSLFAK